MVPVSWEITYDCGHRHVRDLSAEPAGERASTARWLQYRACPGCFPLTRLPARAVHEYIATETVNRYALPALTGSMKHRKWALFARNELITTAHTHLTTSGGGTDTGFVRDVIVPARRILSAAWWIHNRAANPADLPELVNNLTKHPTHTTQPSPHKKGKAFS